MTQGFQVLKIFPEYQGMVVALSLPDKLSGILNLKYAAAKKDTTYCDATGFRKLQGIIAAHLPQTSVDSGRSEK